MKTIIRRLLIVAGLLLVGLFYIPSGTWMFPFVLGMAAPNLWMKSGTTSIVGDGGTPPNLINCSECPCSYCSLLQHNYSITSSSSSGTDTWPSTTTAGSLLVASVGIQGSQTISSTSPGWTLAKLSTAGLGSISIYYILNSVARSGTETFTLSGTASSVWVDLQEYKNPGGGTFDITASNNGTGTALDSGTTGTTTLQNEIAVSAFWYDLGSGPFTSPTNGFGFVDQVNSVGVYYGAVLNKFLIATGAEDCSITATQSQNWAGAIATFGCGYITTACCGNTLPNVLHATLTNPTNCPDTVIELIWQSGGGYTTGSWFGQTVGNINGCCKQTPTDYATFRFYCCKDGSPCPGGTCQAGFGLDQVCSVTAGGQKCSSPTSATCSPLNVVFGGAYSNTVVITL